MSLPEIIKLVRHWWWILLIAPLIAGASAFLISSSMTPIYEAQATALIEHPAADGVANDLQSIQAAERRTQTLSRLVTTRSVLEPVIEELRLERGVEEFRESISVSPVRETQLVTIAVEDPDPEYAAELTNAIAESFAAYVREIQTPSDAISDGDFDQIIEDIDQQIESTQAEIDELQSNEESDEDAATIAGLESSLVQLQQARAALDSVQGAAGSGTVGSEVRIVEPAAAPSSPISPRTLLNTALATFLGLLIGAAMMVGLSWIDDNVKTEQDLRALVERPVLGTVPIADLPEQMEGLHAGRSMSGEIFRGLRTNLQFMMVDRDVKSIAISSVGPGEGKTTVSANLAIVLAQGGQRVILVDADMRRPRVQTLFHRVRNDRGLANLLIQSPAVIEDYVQSTTIKNLKVLTTGPLPPNPPDLLGSSRMKALVSALEEMADIVIFDSPPVAISESLLLASLADGVLFVVRAGKNRTGEIVQGVDAFAQTGVPVLGLVLNGVPKDSQAAHRVYQQYYPLVGSEHELPRPKSRIRRFLSRG
jgi:polysaccharide biosynthesis transport protein